MGVMIDAEPATVELGQWLRDQQGALAAQVQGALRATMFSNRFELRPAQFGALAREEAAAFTEAVLHSRASGEARGARLCRAGLGEEGLLRVAQVVRRFLMANAPPEVRLDLLERTEIYHSGVIRGYMTADTTLTLEEQERIRSAIQRTVSRYAVQMAVAAEVARAATSILDLEELLQTAVELIRESFGLYYVALFLTDAEQRWAYLQASAGEAGEVMLRRGHRLKIGGDSLVGWCVAHGEWRIALDVGEKAISFDTPVLTDIHSEMVIPLISRGKVIGAMAVQSRQIGAFSEQDVAVLRITADQLANAIENARLFREREQQISQLSMLNEMGRALSAALDHDALLETVHQQVGRIYDASYFSIATYDAAADIWKVDYDCRNGVRQSSSSRPRGADLIGYVVRHRQPLLLANRRELAEFFRSHALADSDIGVRSWMGVPLIAADRVVGVMTIASTGQEDRYSEQDLVIFTTIAAQVAVAIVNARLYERLRQELLDRVRAAEELREAKDAAESASRAKSTFLANMSHELRTPLTGIIGYSELLQREAGHFGYGDFLPDLRKIHMAGTHLLSIINDILDLSKIESGKMQTFIETFSVQGLLDEVQSTAAPLLEKNGNQFSLQLSPGLTTMHSDLTKVRQVILNLLSNAAKFTTAGQVVLRAEHVERNGAAWARISVSDTGIGISEEQLARLFQDFTQADASMTRKYGGTGLGLALSRRLSEMLGGEIQVASTLGQGSTFTVWFPLNGTDSRPAPAPSEATVSRMLAPEPPKPHQKRETVLIIDDDPDTRDFLTRCLIDGGMDVVAASSGEEGIGLARALQPSVITLDVLMPGMDGWEVLTALKSDPALADVPVVMLTVVDERDRAFILGASAYLMKPIDRQQVIDVIGAYCGQGAAAGGEPAPVLVVEDDDGLRELLCRTLSGAGLAVIAAADGHTALKHIVERRPAAILLDLMMPGMDGIQLVSALRDSPEYRAIPIVVLTGGELSAQERESLSQSVEQVLQKGAVGRDEVIRHVRDVVLSYQTRTASEHMRWGHD